MDQRLPNQNRVVAGAVVGELFIIGAIAVSLVEMESRKGLTHSLALLIPGIGLLVAAEAFHSLSLLLIGTAIGGVAGGLGYRHSLQDVNEFAPEDKRSEVVSTSLIACYGGISLPVIGVAILGNATGPLIADSIFAGVIALLCIVVTMVQFKISGRLALK